VGAASCSYLGEELAATNFYPREFSCGALQQLPGTPVKRDATWAITSELADGPVHLSVVGVGEKQALGFGALVHDLSYVQHRENTTRNHLLLAFFLLALSAAGVTLFAARFAWHGWIKEFSEALTGEPTKDILPLVRYLRELVERITQERVEEPREG